MKQKSNETLLGSLLVRNVLHRSLSELLRSVGLIVYRAPISFYTIFIEPFLVCVTFSLPCRYGLFYMSIFFLISRYFFSQGKLKICLKIPFNVDSF